jgi:hypothetical protein
MGLATSAFNREDLHLSSDRAHRIGKIETGGVAGPRGIGWCSEMGLGSFGKNASRR